MHKNAKKPTQNSVLSALEDNIYSSDPEDDVTMALAEKEQEEDGEEEEKEESLEEKDETEEKEEQPEIPQKRKNVGAAHGSKSM